MDPQIIQPPPKKLPPNVIRMQITRDETSPLVCPFMSSIIPMDIAAPAVMGGQPRMVMQAIVVGCNGADCAVWDVTRGACGARA